MPSGRLFQATGPATQNAWLPCPGPDQISTSSGTESRKVGNSRNLDAPAVYVLTDLAASEHCHDRSVWAEREWPKNNALPSNLFDGPFSHCYVSTRGVFWPLRFPLFSRALFAIRLKFHLARLDSTRSTLSSQSSKSRRAWRARRAVLFQHGGRRTILYKFSRFYALAYTNPICFIK